MSIIFDLDQTLVDTKKVKSLRDSGQWSKVYSLVQTLEPYAGISNLINTLLNNNIELAIVTASPRPYLDKILKSCKWNIKYTVAYHDTKLHKPYPDPLLKAINLMNIKAEKTFSIGDSAKDIIASQRGGLIACAALWDSAEKKEIIDLKPDYIFQTIDEMIGFLYAHYKLK